MNIVELCRLSLGHIIRADREVISTAGDEMISDIAYRPNAFFVVLDLDGGLFGLGEQGERIFLIPARQLTFRHRLERRDLCTQMLYLRLKIDGLTTAPI